MTTYHGIAASLTGPMNGARGRKRKRVPLDLVVLHLWVSPEDGPWRYLHHLNTPNLPGVSGRVFQSRHPNGSWLWETPSGSQTTDPNNAKIWAGRPSVVYRSKALPYTLIPGISRTPWTYGAGYHGVAGVDGEPYWACDPDLYSVNANPPVNDRAVSFCLPGRYQTREQWLVEGESRDFIRAAAKAIVWAHQRFDIPLERLDARALRAGARGYTDHAGINAVWHQSNHGDLGAAFPWDVLADDIATLTGANMARLANIVEIPPDWPTSPCVTHPGFYIDHGGILEKISSTNATVRAKQKSITGDPADPTTVSAIDRSTLGSYRTLNGDTHPPIAAGEFLP